MRPRQLESLLAQSRVLFACTARAKGCVAECVSITAGVPPIAADLLHRPSWQPWAISGYHADVVVYRRLTQLGHRFRPGMLAVGKTPSRSANPATLLGNLLIAIEARDLLPASLGEGVGQRALGHLVAVSGAGKDRNSRNPAS